MNSSIVVRLQPGTVRESERVAHLADTPEDGCLPTVWHTYCGLHMPAEASEVLSSPTGMPCTHCLARRTQSAEPVRSETPKPHDLPGLI